MVDDSVKKEISRLRSEVRKLSNKDEVDKVVQKLKNPFTGAVTGNYWSQTGQPWVNSDGRKAVLTEWFWQPIRGQPRRVDTNELRQFSQTFWVYSCVTTLLDEVSAIDWDIVPTEGIPYDSVRKEIETIKSWLKYPNKNRESFTTILRALGKDIMELDAGVMVKVFSLDSYDFDELEPKSGAPMLKPLGQRKLVELYARDGSSFLKETDKFGFTKGYWQYSYQIPAHPMWFNKDEICYIARNQRSMSVYGYSPVQAILDIVKSLHYSTNYNRRFFEDTAIPDGVLSVLDTNETEMKSFIDNWTSEYKGQPHKFAVVNKDIKWQPFNVTQRELEFLETQNWYFKLVISAFGLTPTELGLTDDANRATSASQAELSRRKGIRPYLTILEQYINEDILPEFGVDGVEFQFIYDDPTEKAQRLANWQIELSSGLKSVNEVRNEMGLQPVEWGDLPQTSLGRFQDAQNGLNPQNNSNNQGNQTEEGVSSESGQVDGEVSSQRREEAQTKKGLTNLSETWQGDQPVITEEGMSKTLIRYKLIKEGLSDEQADGVISKIKGVKDEIDRRLMLENLYNRLGDDMYLVLVSMGIKPIEAATIVQRLKLRGRTKSADLIEFRDTGENKEMLRASIASELSAISLYESMAEKTDDEDLKIIFLSIAQEEKVHVGEFQAMLDKMDKEQETSTEEGKNEAEDLTKGITYENNFLPGQYYNEPNQQFKPNKVPDQPQNPKAGPVKVNQKKKNDLVCPSCGKATLETESTELGLMYRCVNCKAFLKEDELMDLENLMTETPKDKPVEIPNFIPKSADLDVMKLKEYVGFDYTKAISDVYAYADSTPYKELLYDYFKQTDQLKPLSDRQINGIIEVLKDGVKFNRSTTEIANKLAVIVKDKDRARNIARTETVRIINEGERVRLKREGYSQVVWISAPEDGRLCEECARRNGKRYSLKDIKGEIPLHPSCRCTFKPIGGI